MTRIKAPRYYNPKIDRPIYIVQQDESVIPIEEVAKRLNLGLCSTRKLVEKGYLDTLQITREKNILITSLNEFIRNNKNKDLRDLLRD